MQVEFGASFLNRAIIIADYDEVTPTCQAVIFDYTKILFIIGVFAIARGRKFFYFSVLSWARFEK